jgi:chromosome segregation ATPase
MSLNQLSKVLTFILLSSLAATSAIADEATEAKLRETLRNTMLQLRTAQNDRAALQATQTENEARLKTLSGQVEKLTKDAAAAEKLNTDHEAQLTKFREALEHWEAAYKQAVEVANTKEAARATLADEVIELKQRVEDQRRRNAALFETASEILTRYEKFGLGQALAAKEPFVGVTRVKLENLVQDYEDKLADQRIKTSEQTQPVGNRTADQPTVARRQNSGSPAKP